MEFWRRVWRRKWLVVVPVMLSTVAASIVAWRMPVIYRSETGIIVVPQRIPQSYNADFSVSLTYRFGSLFNNIVNPRFGRD